MTVRILIGDVRARLRELPDESVHAVVTSPPYWSLRSYLPDNHPDKVFEIGQEATPKDFVAELVDVFREVRRVLRADGTLWLNLGDSYAGSGRGGNPTVASSTLQGGQETQRASMIKRTRGVGEIGSTARDAAVTNTGRRATRGSQKDAGLHETARHAGALGRPWIPPPARLKEKDLIGLPWMVAMALRDDGWWLRQALPWIKRNSMPESTDDRPTTAVEYVFQLTKSERYFYDYKAVQRTASASTHRRLSQAVEAQAGSLRANGGAKTNGPMKAVRAKQDGHGRRHDGFNEKYDRKAAERGSGIKNNTSMDAALAVMPEKRALRNSDLFFDAMSAEPFGAITDEAGNIIALDVTTSPFKGSHFATFPPKLVVPLITASCPTGGVILDPFFGAGTTGLVAARFKRDCIGIELSPEYAEMARQRISADAPLLGEVA